MKIKEITEKSDKELQKLLTDLKGRVLKAKFEIASRERNNHREIRSMKRDMARILTIMNERAFVKEEESRSKNEKKA